MTYMRHLQDRLDAMMRRNIELADENLRLRAEVEEYREALKPFVGDADDFTDNDIHRAKALIERED